MATSRSIALMGLFVVVSTGQSLLEFRAMRADSRVLLQLVDQRRASQRHLRNNKLVNVSESINLLAIVIDSTRFSFLPAELTGERLIVGLLAVSTYVRNVGEAPSPRKTGCI
ncbi:hypothetical protein PF010_g5037 [Phytophthora fragariae]|uniref:RxLR effector protein n=1 Tax=Phytophthora fragariae TaxID=53985 RepID=A0A6G0LPG1_9STRA|nr:hypothetical protein PF010_g5037 [Phytophthora fragariae]KAE9242817.1 hypothetical protein PF004_g6449 [Phytophthora fragariae]